MLGCDGEEGWEKGGGRVGGLLDFRGVRMEEVRYVNVETNGCTRPMYEAPAWTMWVMHVFASIL